MGKHGAAAGMLRARLHHSELSPKILLVAEVFDGWGGDVEIKALNATVVMDSPKKVVARWRRDYSMLALAATTVAGVSMLIHFGRKRRITALQNKALLEKTYEALQKTKYTGRLHFDL